MKRIVILFFAWLLLATMGFAIGSLIFNPNETSKFTEKGNSIYGKVTAKDADNHATVRYSYIVNGKEFFGAGGAGRGNPNFDQLQIGQQVVVFYMPEHPEESILGYPQLYSQSQYTGILFTTIFFPVFPLLMIFALYKIIKSNKKSEPLVK
jgi:hypothetical protein